MLLLTHFALSRKALESIECANKLVELGIKAATLNGWNRTAPFFTLDLSVLAQYTKYPYVLLLPQNKTEDLLEEHLKGLGIDVQRPYKAVGIKGDVGLGDTEVLFESGEVIKAQYVIGADGARSAVRTTVMSDILPSFHSTSRFASCVVSVSPTQMVSLSMSRSPKSCSQTSLFPTTAPLSQQTTSWRRHTMVLSSFSSHFQTTAIQGTRYTASASMYRQPSVLHHPTRPSRISRTTSTPMAL
jgi:2-polyprenyl-6-methoxyphenol hydroxylase-like FAD-dependent oxidoreductase